MSQIPRFDANNPPNAAALTAASLSGRTESALTALVDQERSRVNNAWFVRKGNWFDTAVNGMNNVWQDFGGFDPWGYTPPTFDGNRLTMNRDELNTSITSRIINSLYLPKEKGFIPNERMMKNYGVDDKGDPLPNETILDLTRARSEEEMSYIREMALRRMEIADRTKNVPMALNLAATFAAGTSDPTVVLSSMVTGGASGIVAESIIARTGFGSIQALLARGVLAGGENALQGAALNAAVGDDYGVKDALRDATIGMAFSAPGIAKGMRESFINGSRTVQISDAAGKGFGLTEKGAAEMVGEVPGARPGATADEIGGMDVQQAMDSLDGKDLFAVALTPTEFMRAFEPNKEARRVVTTFESLPPTWYDVAAPTSATPPGVKHISGTGWGARVSDDGTIQVSDDWYKWTPDRRRASVEKLAAKVEVQRILASEGITSPLAGTERIQTMLGLGREDASGLVREVYRDAAKLYRAHAGRSLFEPVPPRILRMKDILERTEPVYEPYIGQKVLATDGRTGVMEGTSLGQAKVKFDDGTTGHVSVAQITLSGDTPRGWVEFAANGSAAIKLTAKADATTLTHELDHITRVQTRTVSPELADTLNDYYNQSSDQWSVRADEQYARDIAAARAGKDTSKTVREALKMQDGFVAALKSDPIKEPGPNQQRVQTQMNLNVADAEARANGMRMMEASAKAWAKATGQPVDDWFDKVLKSVERTNEKPIRVLKQEEEGAVKSDFDFSATPDGKAKWAAARMSPPARVGTNPSAQARWTANALADNTLPTLDSKRSPYNAESQVRAWTDRLLVEAVRTSRAIEAEVVKDIPIYQPFRRVKAVEDFRAKVSSAKRRGEVSPDPHVEKSRLAFNKVFQNGHDFAVRNGLEAFKKFGPNDAYLSRIVRTDRFLDLVHKYDFKQLAKLIYKGQVSGGLDMGSELGPLYALARAKRYAQITAADALELPEVSWGAMSRGQLETALTKLIGTEATPAQITDITKWLADEGQIGREPNRSGSGDQLWMTRRRMALDETVRETLTDKEGKTAEVGIEDFLENDVENIAHRYVRAITGEAAAHQVVVQFNERYGTKHASVDELLENVGRDMLSNGVGEGKAKRDLARLDGLFKIVRGQPIYGDHPVWTGLAEVRKFNQIVLSGSFGVNAVAEGGTVAARLGLGTVARQLPYFSTYMKEVTSGNINSDVVREAMMFAGMGNDRLFRRGLFDPSSPDAGYSSSGDKRLSKFQRATSAAVNISNDISGNAPFTMFTEIATGVSIQQKWSDYARSGKLPAKKRLEVQGLSHRDAEAFTREISTHGEYYPGTKAVKSLHLELWDPENAATFRAMMKDTGEGIILRPSAGHVPLLMNSPLGRLATQFRGFPIAAYEKTLLPSLYAKDTEAMNYFVASSMIGAIQYIGMAYIDSVGQDDPKGFLAKRLTSDAIARGAFSRAAYASIIPTVYDTFATRAGYETLGGYRATGLASDPIVGNPTFRLVTEGSSTPFRMLRSMYDSGYSWSQEDQRAAQQLIPFSRLLGVSQGLNYVRSRLPAKSKDEYGWD